MIPRIKPTDLSGNVEILGHETFGKVEAKSLPYRQLNDPEDKTARIGLILSPLSLSQSATKNIFITSVRLNPKVEE